MLNKRHYLLLIVFLQLFESPAQVVKRLNTFRYSINEGLLQSHVKDMTFDKYGFGWLSFSNGLQKFNGKNFENIPIQQCLPDDKNLNMALSDAGEIYYLSSENISWYNADKNKFIIIYHSNNNKISSTYFLGELNQILYFFFADKTIIGLKKTDYQKVFEISLNPEIPFSENLITGVVAADKLLFNYGNNLFSLSPKNKSIHRIRDAQSISFYTNFSLGNDANAILGFSKANNKFIVNELNINTAKKTLNTTLEPIDKRLERLFIYKSKKFNLISIYNEVYEMDGAFKTIKSKWLNFQNTPCAGEAFIDQIKEDQFGNIYLLTLNDGFRKIISNNFPIKYYGIPQKDGNNIISLLANKDENTILAGTFGNGLLVFDTLQKLKFHLKKLPGGESNFSISSIVRIKENQYLLLQFHQKNAWLFNTATYTIQPVATSGNKFFGFFGTTLINEKNKALVQYESSFLKIDIGKNIIFKQFNTNEPIALIGSMLYKNELLTGNKEFLAFYDTSNFRIRKKIVITQIGGIRSIAKDKADNIYLGCDKGLLKIDSTGKQIWKLEKKDGLPDDCIYSIQPVENDEFWCSTNKGIFKLTTDKKIVVLRKEDGLQENEFNTNISFKDSKGELYFGGVNGVSAFYPDQINSIPENVQLMITDIKIDGEAYFRDTGVWNLTNITLPYNKNNISISFTAFGQGNPDQYVYQYKMETVDGNWTLDNLNGNARYTLQPGKYEFKMFASKSFDKNAKPLKILRIQITAPFWKKAWFWLGIGFLLLGFLAFNINLYIKRKFAKKLNVLQQQQKIQEERERISKELHDNIGVQANAILHNATLLSNPGSNKDHLAVNLKDTAKLMLVNLRETLWVMKSNDITAIELWLRIMNFTKQMGRNYSEIQFTIEGQAPENVIIGSNKALHIILVVQEAVNNAIKHADASQITISSIVSKTQWLIKLTDNGKGFIIDIEKLKTDNFGIMNMRQRAVEGQFDFNMSSILETGTTITLQYPL